ncbi:MAG TPA: Gfo/Idh/MocA family oxidoreductase, partial [Chloroflexota bacterium]|nr:Gfo/Idh/MocA family oxidoreductase [Chloroflexota bacterium]
MSYGVGIVGLGRIAQGHIGAISKAEGVHLAAVCDLDATRLDRVTKEQNCPGEPTLERLLARDDVDIALILLPHALHEDATIAAARAGKHVMVEKPMAMEVEACDRMIDAASKTGAKLFVAHTERFLSANRKAKELLDAGEVGTPIMAT